MKSASTIQTRRGAQVRIALIILTVTGLIAGCDRAEDRPMVGDSIRSGWASAERPATVERIPAQGKFLMTAAENGLFEIEASKLALSRAGSAAVRRFAEATLRDRVSIDTDLQQLAASVGVALPSRVGDTLQARLAVLEQLAGADFDRAYARNVGVMAQEETLSAFEGAADRHGARVQRFAADQLPSLRRHLAWARALASELERTTMA